MSGRRGRRCQREICKACDGMLLWWLRWTRRLIGQLYPRPDGCQQNRRLSWRDPCGRLSGRFCCRLRKILKEKWTYISDNVLLLQLLLLLLSVLMSSLCVIHYVSRFKI